MPPPPKNYEFSSDSDDGNGKEAKSDSQRSKRLIKSPSYHKEYLTDNDYDSAITGAINNEKIAAKSAMKQQILKPPLRLRQNNASQNINDDDTHFVSQTTLTSTDSQSNVMSKTQESPKVDMMSLKRDIEDIRQEIGIYQKNFQTYLDKALSDQFAKIQTLIEEKNGAESSIHDERANMIISAIENVSFEAPSKRKLAKKNNDIRKTGGTWCVSVGEEKQPLYMVNLDLRKLLIANTKEFLVTCKRAPDDDFRKFLDKQLDPITLARDLDQPQKIGLTVADVIFPREVQIFFKFYHSLTRVSKRPPLPEDKMKAYKQALMYCGMGCLCIKEERKAYYASAIEALNGRASHWSLGGKRTDYSNDDGICISGNSNRLEYRALHEHIIRILYTFFGFSTIKASGKSSLTSKLYTHADISDVLLMIFWDWLQIIVSFMCTRIFT